MNRSGFHREGNLLNLSDDEGNDKGTQIVPRRPLPPQPTDSLIGKINGLWRDYGPNRSAFLDAVFRMEHMGVQVGLFDGLPAWAVPVPHDFDYARHLGSTKHGYIMERRLRINAVVDASTKPKSIKIFLNTQLDEALEDVNKRFDAVNNLWNSYDFLCYWAFEARTFKGETLPILRALDLYMIDRMHMHRMSVQGRVAMYMAKSNTLPLLELPIVEPPTWSPAPNIGRNASDSATAKDTQAVKPDKTIAYGGNPITIAGADASLSESSENENDDNLVPLRKTRGRPEQAVFTRQNQSYPRREYRTAPGPAQARPSEPPRASPQLSYIPPHLRSTGPTTHARTTSTYTPRQPPRASPQLSAIPSHLQVTGSGTTTQVRTVSTPAPRQPPPTKTTSGYNTPGEAIARCKEAGNEGEHDDSFRTWCEFFKKQLKAHDGVDTSGPWVPIENVHLLFVRFLHSKFGGNSEEPSHGLRLWAVETDQMLKKAAEERRLREESDHIFSQALKGMNIDNGW